MLSISDKWRARRARNREVEATLAELDQLYPSKLDMFDPRWNREALDRLGDVAFPDLPTQRNRPAQPEVG